MFLTHSGTVLNGVHCGVSLSLIAFGTVLTSVLSTFIFAFLGCFLTQVVPVVLRFSEKERACDMDGLKQGRAKSEETVRPQTAAGTH